MSSLLSKTRKMNRMIQRSANVAYESVARVLSDVIDANVYLVSKEGEIYGYAFQDDFECDLMVKKVISANAFPRHYVHWMNRIDETEANLRSKSGMCAFEEDTKCMFNGKNTTIVPIYAVGSRIGTLIIAKYDEEFDDDDLVLAEYGATVVGMEMLRDQAQRAKADAQQKATVEVAIGTLSPSEQKAALGICYTMKCQELEEKAKVDRIVRKRAELEAQGKSWSKFLESCDEWYKRCYVPEIDEKEKKRKEYRIHWNKFLQNRDIWRQMKVQREDREESLWADGQGKNLWDDFWEDFEHDFGYLEDSEERLCRMQGRKFKYRYTELDPHLIVASDVADAVNVTRSVIVNALRKLESAGVITSESQGMKGTQIEIVNKYLADGLEEEREAKEKKKSKSFKDIDIIKNIYANHE